MLAAALLLGGCHRVDGGKEESSAPPAPDGPQSREESSRAASSQPDSSAEAIGETASSEAVSSETVSSEAEAPANAVPEPIAVDGVELPDLSQFDNTQVTWGPGHQMDGQNRPTACTGLQEQYGEDGGLFIMPAGEKKIYLTFDEGYENGYTGKILDVLREKECPAVFFVTYDYVSRNPELVQRMVDEGHTVGNHSMNHPNMTTIDAQTAVKEIADLHNYVAEHFNFQMTLFRPPEGAFSRRSLIIARELGYRTALWSYAYADWDPEKQMAPDAAFPKVTGAAHDGAIYLLHAVSETNTQILGDVIDTLRGEGYTLERLQ